MILMLASDICRLIIREQPAGLLSQLQQWTAGGDELVISAITYAELIAGVLLTAKREKHLALVEACRERLDDVVPWDRSAVDSYRALQTRAIHEGRALNMNDAMVAAHAISLDAVLLTANEKPFANIEELKLRTWEQKR